MKTHAHYTAQVEAVLREAGRPFVAVDDAKKAIQAGAKIDSFDFLIYATNGDHLLAIVLPPSRPRPTAKQVGALSQWASVFGKGFAGAFIRVGDPPTAWWAEGTAKPMPLRQFLGVEDAAPPPIQPTSAAEPPLPWLRQPERLGRPFASMGSTSLTPAVWPAGHS